MKNIKSNEKEIIFMGLLCDKIQIFSECSKEEALYFICSILDELKIKGIKII